jgi:hypothetical protein
MPGMNALSIGNQMLNKWQNVILHSSFDFYRGDIHENCYFQTNENPDYNYRRIAVDFIWVDFEQDIEIPVLQAIGTLNV